MGAAAAAAGRRVGEGEPLHAALEVGRWRAVLAVAGGVEEDSSRATALVGRVADGVAAPAAVRALLVVQDQRHGGGGAVVQRRAQSGELVLRVREDVVDRVRHAGE